MPVLTFSWGDTLNAMLPFLQGDTICARGTSYAFFFRRGTVNKLVVEFEGGGACWDKETCR